MKKIIQTFLLFLTMVYTIFATWASCSLGFRVADPIEAACTIGLAMSFFAIGGVMFIGVLWLMAAMIGD